MQPAPDDIVLVRGGGDIATGVVWRLHHAGFRVVVAELSQPLTIRRTVAVSSAVVSGHIDIEGLAARRCDDESSVHSCWNLGEVPVVVAPTLGDVPLSQQVSSIIDCRLAKQPLDSTVNDADIVIGLGPGFTVGTHCHAVVETMRGHRLGRALFSGMAEPNTGSPGEIEGKSAERVIRAPRAGRIDWSSEIGDWVEEGSVLGVVLAETAMPVHAPFTGMVRGLIAPDLQVSAGLKIADIEPRHDPEACTQISDKALAVGGGVVEALHRLSVR